MNEQQVKEFLFQAVQAGKQETSGLVRDIMFKLDNGIDKAVEKYVNGHLKEIKNHLGDQDSVLKNILAEQNRVKNELIKFHNDTDPIVDKTKALTLLGKIIGGAIGTTIGILTILKLIR